MLQCEVFVDSIAKLQLLTTVRKLVVGDLMILQVQAFDREGFCFWNAFFVDYVIENVFTSLDGLNFKWETSEDKDG